MRYLLPYPSRLFFLSLLMLALAAPGCKKTEEPPAPTNSEKILGTWIEKERWTDDDHDGTFVLHSEPCDGDAVWTFNADKSHRLQDDNTACDDPFPIDITSHWEIIGDSTHLQFIIPGLEDEPVDVRIDALSDTEMTLHTFWPADPAAPTEDKIVLRR